MGDWPLYDGQGTETGGVTSASSVGVAVTAGGSNNTKGAWSELIASTSRPATGLLLTIGRGHTTIADILIDIGIGAASSEVVVVPNLKGDNGSNLLGPGQVLIPVAIPPGSRIAARSQATAASAISRVQAVALYGSFLTQPPLSRVTDYGTATADSGGVSVDPGGTANTKGAYSQIVASTTNPARALLIGIGNQNNSSRTTADWLIDVAIGAGGSEQIILADIHLEASASDDVMAPAYLGPIPCAIPAGTRLAVRAQSTTIDATDRLFDVQIWGID